MQGGKIHRMAMAWEVLASDDEAADSPGAGSSLASSRESLDRTTLSLSTGNKRMKTEEGSLRVASPDEEPGEVEGMTSCVQGHQREVLEAWPAMVLHGFDPVLRTMGVQEIAVVLETGCSGTNSVAIALEVHEASQIALAPSYPNVVLTSFLKKETPSRENGFILTDKSQQNQGVRYIESTAFSRSAGCNSVCPFQAAASAAFQHKP
eukprot:6490518-Amphidinium_carterae.3